MLRLAVKKKKRLWKRTVRSPRQRLKEQFECDGCVQEKKNPMRKSTHPVSRQARDALGE